MRAKYAARFTARAYGQEPPCVTACGAESPAHCSSHVEPFAHDIEQPAVQRIVHVEPPLQSTLPLGPTVRSHVDWPAQLTLHDSPHCPVHVLPFVQASEQLDPAHPELPRSHEVWAGHEHEVPLQVGGGGGFEPQPATRQTR